MKRKRKKIGAIFMALVMICTMICTMILPTVSVQADGETIGGITITLDQGEYDGTFKTDYGTIEYSTNSDPSSDTWTELSDDIDIYDLVEGTYPEGGSYTNHNYNLPSNSESSSESSYVWIKVTLSTAAVENNYIVTIPDAGNEELISGTPKQLTQGCHISIGPGGNNPDDGNNSDDGDNPNEPSNSSRVELMGLSGTDGQIATISQEGTIVGTVSCSLGDITALSNVDRFEYQNVTVGNNFTITIMPEAGFSPQITCTNRGITYNTQAQICQKNEDGSYTFSLSLESGDNGCLGIEIGCEKIIEASIDIVIGGKTYRVGNGSIVKGNFDIKKLDLVITRIYENEEDTVGTGLTDCRTVGFTPDNQGRNPLEIFTTKEGTNCVTVNIENHEGGNPANPLFYFTNITFANENANFVGVDSGIETFLFQDTVATDKAELSPSIETPTEFTFYYGSDSVTFSSPEGEQEITNIELAEDIANGAVTIDGKTVTFHSPYYNSVVLKVTLADGTIGYVQINRIGMSIDGYQFKDSGNTAWHGSQSGPDLSNANNINKFNVIASFYFDGATGSDYDLISIATFVDGHTETSVVEAAATDSGSPYGEVKVADYILWTGAKADAPVQVAVTAVKHGATSSANSFGGAAFGAGMGVVKKIDKD